MMRAGVAWSLVCVLAVAAAALSIDAPVAAAAEAKPDVVRQPGPLAGVEEIVFAVRPAANYHYYENFGHFLHHVRQCYAPPEQADAGPPAPLYHEGGRLCRLNFATGELKVLLDDPQGGVRDPWVDYDGRTIVFSYRKGGEPCYHLYRIDADGAGLTQLTDGPYDDIEPCGTPDGGILFCSSRARRYVGCFPAPVATLYRCQQDGSDVHPVSASPFTDNTPWMLPDGRALFTRWEYVDRNQLSFHHLWTMNPDGTEVMAFFGNQYTGQGTPIPRFSDYAMLDGKPIPGTRQIVASFSPDHGRGEHLGYITVVDPSSGPDAMASAKRLRADRQFRDPYALSADCFLVADPKGIWTMDAAGKTELVFQLPATAAKLECHEPRPLAARPREPVVHSRVERKAATGRLVLSDVYHGRNMEGIGRGEIKRLLVLEQLPKPVQFSGGQEPLTIGGPFALARILGTVPVEADGSAYLEVPALRALYFAALDENGLAVKRMHSFASVMPGETMGCVGCHEHRTNAPPKRELPSAVLRPPSPIEPVAGVPDVFDYPRDIQPILDRHCVACHNADRWEGKVDLSGDRTPLYSRSYWSMVTEGLIADGRNFTGNMPPRTVGSSASRLLRLVDGSHHGARVTPRERDMLRLWIDSGATYPGTYAALGSGIALAELPTEVIERRCASCHRAEPQPYVGMQKNAVHYQFGRRGPPQVISNGLIDFLMIRRLAYFKPGEAPPPQELCNLTQPQKSLLLRAPLAAAAGGLGLCGPAVFANASDADYQQILAAVAAAASQLDREKRFDMPGFRPNRYYVRLMQSYGILPVELAPQEPIDSFATDRAYWDSLYWKPVAEDLP